MQIDALKHQISVKNQSLGETGARAKALMGKIPIGS